MSDITPSKEAQYIKVIQQLRALPFSNGFLWVKSGWAFFKLSPGKAVLSALILTLTSLFIALIPGIGFFASTLLAPCLTAGAFLVWQGFQERGSIDFEDLFGGFRNRLEALILLGLLNWVGMIGVLLLTLVIAGGLAFFIFSLNGEAALEVKTLLTNLIQHLAEDVTQGDTDSGSILTSYPVPHLISLVVLVGLGLSVPLIMAQAFSPAFVVFKGLSAWDAMKASFWACYRNVWPFLAYSLGLSALYLLGILTLGLGLALAPAIQMASTYYSFTDILGEVPNRT